MKKQAIRKIFSTKRAELTPLERQEKSQQIGYRIIDLLDEGMQNIHVFVPIVTKHEVNTFPLVESLWQQGRQVIAPQVAGPSSMTHHWWTPETVLNTNSWGIPEPSGAVVDPTELDVVVIPLLAIDQKGHRVGYGKGFYDRFLSQCKAGVLTIGVGFFPPVPAIADIMATDIALDVYVTQDQTWFFSS